MKRKFYVAGGLCPLFFTMNLSRSTILAPLHDSEGHLLANLLTGEADIIPDDVASEIKSGIITDEESMVERGYLADPVWEKRVFDSAYRSFLERRDSDEIQLFFVPGYDCTFACSYCYQSGYTERDGECTRDVTDAFFDYIMAEFAGRRKYVTLFGGEPLIASPARQTAIAYFLARSSALGIDTAIVTNGYQIGPYLPILETSRIREVQVTLDGVGAVHDLRRPLKNGGPTFAAIVAGIDDLLARRIPVNLRVVIDSSNIDHLAELARFAIDKGWTQQGALFKTQIGRNYELHYCQTKSDQILGRTELAAKLYEIAKTHSEFLEFHRPNFAFARELVDNGELPEPIFDSCPGCKTEWAFDASGHIFSCTATVGKKGEELGSFYPTVTKNEEAIAVWRSRDITTIPACAGCDVALWCGGGCGSIAKNESGLLHSPDCRPIKDLLGMGIALYHGPSATETTTGKEP